MFQLKKILFPVDFSDRCVGAGSFVEAFTGRFEAHLTLLHVITPGAALGAVPELADPKTVQELFELHEKEAVRKLDGFLADDTRQLDVERVVVQGDPATRIVEYAKEHGIDLIMLPTHGLGPFRRYIIGSVTAKVLHDAPCPVWTGVHLEQAPPLEVIHFDNILCAVDLGPDTRGALHFAAGLAAEYQAQLTVVHALPPVDTGNSEGSALAARMLREAVDEIERYKPSIPVPFSEVIEYGDPAAVIHSTAEDRECDLVVIGRGSAAHPGHLRAHAYSIIRDSPAPVVSV